MEEQTDCPGADEPTPCRHLRVMRTPSEGLNIECRTRNVEVGSIRRRRPHSPRSGTERDGRQGPSYFNIPCSTFIIP